VSNQIDHDHGYYYLLRERPIRWAMRHRSSRLPCLLALRSYFLPCESDLPPCTNEKREVPHHTGVPPAAHARMALPGAGGSFAVATNPGHGWRRGRPRALPGSGGLRPHRAGGQRRLPKGTTYLYWPVQLQSNPSVRPATGMCALSFSESGAWGPIDRVVVNLLCEKCGHAS